MARERLTVVAPAPMRGVLEDGLGAVGFQTLFVPRPRAAPRSPDPYGIQEIAGSCPGRQHGVVLVAPRSRSPEDVVPGPVIGSRAVGLLFADRPHQLEPWLESLTRERARVPEWVMLAMWKAYYMRVARRFKGRLRERNPEGTTSWLADSVTREELCRRLGGGPDLAIYFGHGRARGFTGYRGLRWHHVDEAPFERACGTVIGFACDTLDRARGAFPFGCAWVQGGRAAAYLGSVGSVGVIPNTALAMLTLEQLAQGSVCSLAGLLLGIDREIAERPQLRSAGRAFESYRVIGNPLQRFA